MAGNGALSLSERVTDVACPGCGCVCDDLTLTVEDGKLAGVERACEIGERFFLGHAASGRPPAEIEGRPADFAGAVSRAAELLRAADRPLVYGLARSAAAGQRAAVALAESAGAVIDTTASMCHGPSIMALQQVGEITCTLGEVRNHADLGPGDLLGLRPRGLPPASRGALLGVRHGEAHADGP
jgi:formylmethanofuran dehydrogenase subunit B